MEKIEYHQIFRDERLSHLTKEEYNWLFDSYHNSDDQVKTIFTKLNLKGIPLSGLRWALKYRDFEENSCPIHNLYSWQKAIGRGRWGIPFCPACKKPMWSLVTILPTKTKRKNIVKIPFKESKKNLLDVHFYSGLSFINKVTIVAWFLKSEDTKPFLKISTLSRNNFFPSEFLYQEIMEELELSGLFTANKIWYDNIQLDAYLFEQFQNAYYYLHEDGIDLYNLWWRIAFHEIIDYLKYEVEKKNLPSDFIRKNKEVIEYLTKNLPIQQAMFAIWTSIKDSCSMIAERNWDLEFASNIIPKNLKNKSDRLIEGSLNYFSFNRPFSCPQSALSKVFSETIIELNERYFTEAPNMKTLIEVQKWMRKEWF